MIVYRVENIEGDGAYYGGHIDSRAYSHRPRREDDGIPDYSLRFEGYRFGFISMAALWTWFNREQEHKELNRYGFQVSEYDVPDTAIVKGGRQLIFCSNQASLIDTHSLV